MKQYSIASFRRSTWAGSSRIIRLRIGSLWTSSGAWFASIALASISLIISPNVVGILGAALAIVAIAIADIDRRRFVIPNWLNGVGVVVGVLYAIAREPEPLVRSVMDATTRGIVAALALLLLRYVYGRLRGREGIGLGDVKLAGVGGVWLNWFMIPFAIQFAALAALAWYGAKQTLSKRRIAKTDRVPFGLFFAPAIWVCWLLQTILLF